MERQNRTNALCQRGCREYSRLWQCDKFQFTDFEYQKSMFAQNEDSDLYHTSVKEMCQVSDIKYQIPYQ